MDRYIIKTPRPPKNDNEKPSTSKSLKQTTIESMKGVVIVEEIWRLKSVLKLENQTTENILDALEKLDDKIPSRDVLKQTKIGHTINRLTKHEDPAVVEKAAKLVKKWKLHFETKLDRPLIEVKCDKKSEELRKAGRKLLAGALGITDKNNLPEAIEREAYSQHGRRVSSSYRRSVRALVFALKHKEDIKKHVLSGDMQISDFVNAYKKEAKS